MAAGSPDFTIFRERKSLLRELRGVKWRRTLVEARTLAIVEGPVERLPGFHAAAWRLAMRVTGSPEAAEDAVQQAYLEAIARLRDTPPPADECAWFLEVVFTVAKKALRTEARRRRREAAAVSKPEIQPVSASETSGELVAELRGALEALDEKHRLPVSLCCEEGLSHQQAAAVLGIPRPTLSRQVSEGLEELRKALQRAGYAAAPAAVVGALGHTAPAVPAGLAATVQGLVAGGAASAAKAAAGAAAKVSARLGAKKAVGLALGWKVAAAVTVTALGAGAVAVLNPKAPPLPAAMAPAERPAEVIYQTGQFSQVEALVDVSNYKDVTADNPLDPFWLEAYHVGTYRYKQPPNVGFMAMALKTKPSLGGAHMNSRPFGFGGRPLEIYVQGMELPGGPAWSTASPWKQWHVAIFPDDGVVGSRKDWKPFFLTERWTQTDTQTGARTRLVSNGTRQVVRPYSTGPLWGLRVVIDPSGHVVCPFGASSPREKTKDVVHGSVGPGVRSVTLRLEALNLNWMLNCIRVMRLEKWPDDLPAAEPEKGSTP